MKKLSVIVTAIIAITFIFTSCSSKDKEVRRPSVPNNASLKNIVYGSNIDYFGVKKDLDLDVYFPYQTNPSNEKYPLIMYVHGGAFLVGDKSSSEDYCRMLSAGGYVVATINYRIGWDRDTSAFCSGDTVELKEAQYRAIQDSRAALRFLVKNADKYNIDTNWIFLDGASAGAATVLHTTYVTQDSANAFLPGGLNKFGPLDGGTNNIQAGYTIKGMSSQWGALYSKGLITKNNAVPSIFYHGEKDLVCPFNEGRVYTCDNMLYVYGSVSLYNRLRALGKAAVVHIDPRGGHGVYSTRFRTDNNICFFNSILRNNAKKGYYEGEKSSCN